MKIFILVIEWIFGLYVLYHAFFKQQKADQSASEEVEK